MTNYADPTISLADHLAAALKPVDRKVVALALADALGSRVRSGERSVLANALLNGTGIDTVLAEIRDLLDGTTAVGKQSDYVLDGSPESVAIVREARGLNPLDGTTVGEVAS